MVPGADDTAQGLSLWLMPEGASRVRLQALILELAQTHRTPAFPPHLTLIGGIAAPEAAVREGARRMAGRMGPVTIELGEIETGEEFFQCVFARAELTDASRWAELRGQEPFSEAAAHPFRPHLSLVYGHLPSPLRRAVRQDLGGALKLSFAASRLYLFRTEGPPRAWRLRATFPLRG